MSSKKPTSVNYSLDRFAKHGGVTYSNRSGWGIAFYEQGDARIVREPLPASDSPWVKFIEGQKLKSHCVIAHVRLASVGQPLLENTHPFRRELGGRVHIFAHNGTLKTLYDDVDVNDLACRPVGDTDSELAFCLLLQRLRSSWCSGQPPSLQTRFEVFAKFARDMSAQGTANFLYSDGDTLFVHAHRRVYEENGVFTDPKPPGLSIRHSLVSSSEEEYAVDGLRVDLRDSQVTLLASVPLDAGDAWSPLPEGCALALRDGVEVVRKLTHPE